MPICEIDARVGGRFRYEWLHAEGRRMGMSGLFRALEAPVRIEQTQSFDEDWTGGEAISTLVFEERGRGTLLINVVEYVSREVRDRVLRSGMETGMEAGYVRLDALTHELGEEEVR